MSEGTTLGKAWVQIVPSAKGITGSISGLLSGEAASAGTAAGNTLGSSMVSTLKGVIAAAGIGAAVKSAFDEGAALQQSIGGIETLFKDSAGTVQEYAAQAFETAGLSANEYMENVTGFAASLLQGLGGDTAAAAEIANTAMVDMADNANKMGTDMSSIQNAYQGFAKQNYTMLDNLKLGYGGTQEEMARLINDSGVLGDAVEVTAKTVKDVPFDKVLEAIHVIQTELDITGTTAKEASTTFTGSFAAMESAAKNVLGNLTIGADVSPALNGLAETTSTFFFDNFIPMLGNLITALPGAIGTFFTAAAPEFMGRGAELIQTVYNGVMEALPKAAEAGSEILRTLAAGVVDGLPRLAETALPALTALSGSLRENAGKLIDSGLELLKNLAKGFADSLPTLIQNIPTIVSNIAGVINDNAPKLIEAGIYIIFTLAKGIIASIPTLIAEFPKICKAALDVFTAFNWVSLGTKAVNFIKSGVQSLKTAIPDAFRNIGSSAKSFFQNIDWRSAGTSAVNLIKGGISSLLHAIPNALSSIASAARDRFLNINWAQIGRDILNGIWKGITGMADGFLANVGGFVGRILERFTGKEGFDEHSPSKWAETVFRRVLEGGEIGFTKGLPGILAGAESAVGGIQDVVSSASIVSPSWQKMAASAPPSVEGRSYSYAEREGRMDSQTQEQVPPIIVNCILDGQKVGTAVASFQRNQQRAYGY